MEDRKNPVDHMKIQFAVENFGIYCRDPSWWPFKSTEHEWNTEYRAGLFPWYTV